MGAVTRRLAAVLAALVMAVTATLAVPTRATAAEPDPLIGAANHLYSCVQTARTVSVLFVMDRSGSLEKIRQPRDPKGLRFEGMRSALTGLAQLRRPDGRPLVVEAAVSAFNQAYHPARDVVGWTTINGDDSATEINRMVDGARLRATSTGGTDFEEALAGGLSDFRGRTSADACRIMLWFTDGEFEDARGLSLDRDGEAGARRIDQARREMCTATGGVVDRIRAAGIVLLGLQLGDARPDLRRMSVGTFDGQACGTYPAPTGSAPGGYLQARDINELSWVFSRMADLAQGCTPTGPLGGRIDPGLHRMVVRALRPQLTPTLPAQETITLVPPQGERLEVPAPGRREVAGHVLVADRDAAQVSALVTFPEGGGAGTWAIDPGFATRPDTVAFCVFPDLALVRQDGPLPAAGEASSLVHVVRTPGGGPADFGLYRAVTATATVTASDGTRVPAAAEASEGRVTVTVTPRTTDARLDVRLTVEIVSASGLRLPMLTSRYATSVRSTALPSVEPAEVLDLGTAHRLETVSRDLVLTGAAAGPSEVCLGVPQVSQTVDEGGVLQVEQRCWTLLPGQTVAVPVSYTPGSVAVGDGSGSIGATMKGPTTNAQEPATATFDLPVRWRQDNPANQWVLWGVVALALLLTAFVMLLALFLANWVVARFVTERLRHYSVEVWLHPRSGIQPVSGAQVADSGALAPPAVSPLFGHQTPRSVPGPHARTLRIGVVTLRARARFFDPFRGPQFFGTAAEGYRVYSSVGISDPSATWVPVTPTLDPVILVTAADSQIPGGDDQPVRATVHLVTTADSVGDPRDLLSATAIVTEWRRAVERTAATPSPVHPPATPRRTTT